MTDHIPNDLCPQGEHAPSPKSLSPAAQAAWTAYETADCDPYLVDPRKAGIAAAIRALADLMAPSKKDYEDAPHEFATVCLNGIAYAANEMRLIATELEAQ